MKNEIVSFAGIRARAGLGWLDNVIMSHPPGGAELECEFGL